ncbi:Phosphate transport regulator (distant homolog of PhoU) [hydrothermal vent metagenome]|uniref:Phosphate transport regulator (Distant homolog of PhoU) n=1 Tax=hydrothermal vent metagenome TaxID=652676 RepID=A0A3B0ZE29_9ZZZZ
MPPVDIYTLFGNSPVSPLQAHMAKVQACIEALEPFVDAAVAGKWSKAEKAQQKISKIENEADTLKKALRLNLPTGLFMPVSRRDVLEVLTMQDRIANKSKDIAGLMLGRKIEFPEAMHKKLIEFVKRCIDASGQAQIAINELDELVATGFRGNEIKLVASMIKKLNKIENDTDKIQVKVRAMLFKQEKDLPPIDVMFMYKVIDWIGDLADIAQRVGSRLELMLAK